VDAVGLSNYGPKQLARIGGYLQKKGVPLAAVQVQYSLLRWAQRDASLRCAGRAAFRMALDGALCT
jgi:pyridoxine 4-dehydrogenase